MKNIHVLPTDKPSNIWINYVVQRLIYGKFTSNDAKINCQNQSIYITSDEEIKEGDWCLDEDGLKKCTAHAGAMNHYFQKIILTTDQDLIKDGVQAIDDEFLEWFIKNPSCEWVEVGEIYPSNCCINKEGKTKMNNDCMERNRCLHYKIIIPSKDDLKIGDNTNFGIITDINEKSVCFGKNKVGVDVWYKKSYVVKFPNLVLEEPKQKALTNDIDSHSWGFENFEVIKNEEDAKIFVETMENIPEPNDKLKRAFRDFNKQETLEEAADLWSIDTNNVHPADSYIAKTGFMAGAKWQQEQNKNLYSEEEVRKMFSRYNEVIAHRDIEKWQPWIDEQFKNK